MESVQAVSDMTGDWEHDTRKGRHYYTRTGVASHVVA